MSRNVCSSLEANDIDIEVTCSCENLVALSHLAFITVDRLL